VYQVAYDVGAILAIPIYRYSAYAVLRRESNMKDILYLVLITIIHQSWNNVTPSIE